MLVSVFKRLGLLACYLAFAYVLVIPVGFLVHARRYAFSTVLWGDLVLILATISGFIFCWIRDHKYGKLIQLLGISLAFQLLMDILGIVIGGVPLW